MPDLFWLTDAQMARLEPFFPKSHVKPPVDARRVLSGIIFINRNDLRWRDAPSEFGPHIIVLVVSRAGLDRKSTRLNSSH